MGRGAPILLASVLALGGCASKPTLPQAFIGQWGIGQAACLDPESDGRLAVSASGLQFYEWGGDVVDVQSVDDSRVRFDADWYDVNDTDFDERPIKRRKVVELELLADRSALALTVDNVRGDYIRCQGADHD